MKNEVILVNEEDEETGCMEKIEAHQKGLLHRAFSVFIFNYKGELLIHQRAWSKYHSGGLWTNTCCSHPHPGDDTKTAATQRLKEEMGIVAELHFSFTFLYKTYFENGLIENEYDHVFYGFFDQTPIPDKSDVADYKFLSAEKISEEIKDNPAIFTEWFKLCFDKTIAHLRQKNLLP